jgi:hypothetical protein
MDQLGKLKKDDETRKLLQKHDGEPIIRVIEGVNFGGYTDIPGIDNAGKRLKSAKSTTADAAEAEKLAVADEAAKAAERLAKREVFSDDVWKAIDSGWLVEDGVIHAYVSEKTPKTTTAQPGFDEGETSGYGGYLAGKSQTQGSERDDLMMFDGEETKYNPSWALGKDDLPNRFLTWCGGSGRDKGDDYLDYNNRYKSFEYQDENGQTHRVPDPGQNNIRWRREAAYPNYIRYVPWDPDSDKPVGDVAIYVVDSDSAWNNNRIYLASRAKRNVYYNGGRAYDVY